MYMTRTCLLALAIVQNLVPASRNIADDWRLLTVSELGIFGPVGQLLPQSPGIAFHPCLPSRHI